MPFTRRRFLAITAGAFLARMGSADAMPTTDAAAGDPAPTHYELYRTTGPDPGPDDLVTTIKSKDITGTTVEYRDDNREPGRAYYYWVRYMGGGPPRLAGPAVAVAI